MTRDDDCQQRWHGALQDFLHSSGVFVLTRMCARSKKDRTAADASPQLIQGATIDRWRRRIKFQVACDGCLGRAEPSQAFGKPPVLCQYEIETREYRLREA